MSQNAERAAALKKMRAFAAQTTDRGRTEGEMNQAMRELQKLSTAFNISLDELNLKDEPCVSFKMDTGSRVDQAVNSCVRAIAEFTGCIQYRKLGDKELVRDAEGNPIVQTIVRTVRGRRKVTRRFKTQRGNIGYVFYGLESDVEMAKFLYTMIQNSIEFETRIFKKSSEYKNYRGPKKSASHSFQHGMAGRIQFRLNEMADQQAQEVEDSQAGERDIMVIKSDHVEKEFKTTGVRLTTFTRCPRISSGTGYGAGRDAGDRVNLSRPLKDKDDEVLLLG